MTQNKIAIIGAGFSGLTLAWALQKQGFEIDIFESQPHCGGLISTQHDLVMVESAANAVLASLTVENLFSDLKIDVVQAGYQSKKRYIYRNGIRTFPISAFKAASGLMNLLRLYLTKTVKPLAGESLGHWTNRCLNEEFDSYFVSPALQGIYGTQSEHLSAQLIVGFKSELKSKAGRLKGSLSPKAGMQDVIVSLEKYLAAKNIKIYRSSAQQLDLLNSYSATVLAVGLEQSKSFLSLLAPKASACLNQIPTVSLISTTLGFAKEKIFKGFGCLFPKPMKFNSLGVLFNTDIFPNRGSIQSETWIMNDIKSDSVVDLILQDRKRLVGDDQIPIFSKTHQYPKALPLYGFELENFLLSDVFIRNEEKTLFEVFKNGARLIESETPLYMTGNYLGGIGLTKILDYNVRLAARMKKDLV